MQYSFFGLLLRTYLLSDAQLYGMKKDLSHCLHSVYDRKYMWGPQYQVSEYPQGVVKGTLVMLHASKYIYWI